MQLVMRESGEAIECPTHVMLPVCTPNGPIADLESVGKISIVSENGWVSLKIYTMEVPEWGVSETAEQFYHIACKIGSTDHI
jgi:hypothetical protein